MGKINDWFGKILKKNTLIQTESFNQEEYDKQNQLIIDSIKAKYDFDTVSGIESVPVPTEKQNLENLPNVVIKLEYILQRKATEHKRKGNIELAIACLKKSNQIMPFSSVGYARKDYERLVKMLIDSGRKNEADIEQEKIDLLFGKTQFKRANDGYLGKRPISKFKFEFDSTNTQQVMSLKNNQKKFLSDLKDISGYFSDVQIDYNQFDFEPYFLGNPPTKSYLIDFIVEPLTKSGKTPKFPYHVSFQMNSVSLQIDNIHGELYYLEDDNIGKFRVIHTKWVAAIGYLNNRKPIITSYEFNFTTNTGKKRLLN